MDRRSGQVRNVLETSITYLASRGLLCGFAAAGKTTLRVYINDLLVRNQSGKADWQAHYGTGVRDFPDSPSMFERIGPIL